jgi:hypothetical protein
MPRQGRGEKDVQINATFRSRDLQINATWSLEGAGCSANTRQGIGQRGFLMPARTAGLKLGKTRAGQSRRQLELLNNRP